MTKREKIKKFSKGLMVGIGIFIAFTAFVSLVAATDLYLSTAIVDLLSWFGLITILGYSVFGFIIMLLLIVPLYFFWLIVLVLSYSFICERFNIPLKYSIP